MIPFTPDSPQQDILTYLESTNNAVIDAFKSALSETKQLFHSLGTPLNPGRLYDKSYFSHTMRYIAKRSLEERGLRVRIEEEAEAGFQVGQAANTGIALEIPGIFARVLKSPLDEELRPAGSEARADFYEQRQYRLPFPPLEGEESQTSEVDAKAEESKLLNLVYAWDASQDLERIHLKLACPRSRSGECLWQHVFPDIEGTGSVPRSISVSPNPATLIATAASLANTNLDISPKTGENNGEQVKQGATKRA